MHGPVACVLLLCAQHVTAGDDGPTTAAPRPGVRYEHVGRIRIVTGKRDWVAYLSLARYHERWDAVRRRAADARKSCQRSGADCGRLLAAADALEREVTRKKSLIASWLGPGPVRVLYGACDRRCVAKYDGHVRRLRRADVDQQTNAAGRKVKVVRLGGPAAASVDPSLADHALETDALLETVRAAKAGRIDVRQLARLDDVRASPGAEEEGSRELPLDLSDLTAFYSRGNVVFAAAIPLVHPDVFTVYGPTTTTKTDRGYLAVAGSRTLYAAYDRFDRGACKRRARDRSPPLCPAPEAAARRPRELTACEWSPAGRTRDGCDVVWACGGGGGGTAVPSTFRDGRRHGNETRTDGGVTRWRIRELPGRGVVSRKKTKTVIAATRRADRTSLSVRIRGSSDEYLPYYYPLGVVELTDRTCDGVRAFAPGKKNRRRRARYRGDLVPETVVPGADETGGIDRPDNVTGSPSRAKTNGTESGGDDVYAPRANNNNRILFYTTWSVAFLCLSMFVMDYAKKSIRHFRKTTTTPAESVEMNVCVFENSRSSQSNVDLITGDPIETIYTVYPYS